MKKLDQFIDQYREGMKKLDQARSQRDALQKEIPELQKRVDEAALSGSPEGYAALREEMQKKEDLVQIYDRALEAGFRMDLHDAIPAWAEFIAPITKQKQKALQEYEAARKALCAKLLALIESYRPAYAMRDQIAVMVDAKPNISFGGGLAVGETSLRQVMPIDTDRIETLAADVTAFGQAGLIGYEDVIKYRSFLTAKQHYA